MGCPLHTSVGMYTSSRTSGLCLQQNLKHSETHKETIVGSFSTHTISEINVFLRFTQDFKMATKNGRKRIFGKNNCQMTVRVYPGCQKFPQNHSISHRFRDKCALRRNSRWLQKIVRKTSFGKKVANDCV